MISRHYVILIGPKILYIFHFAIFSLWLPMLCFAALFGTAEGDYYLLMVSPITKQVVDKPAPVRISSLLTSRHISQRRIRLPARKYYPKSDGPKVRVILVELNTVFLVDNVSVPEWCFSWVPVCTYYLISVCRCHFLVTTKIPLAIQRQMHFSFPGRIQELW